MHNQSDHVSFFISISFGNLGDICLTNRLIAW